MKHKFLTSALASIMLAGGFETTNFVNSVRPVCAAKYEISDQGFENKKAKQYFKKWRNVVLKDKCEFEQDTASNFPVLPFGDTDYSDIPMESSDISLKAGSIIQIKNQKSRWYARGKLLPNIKYYDWIFPEDYNGSPNNYYLSEDNKWDGYKFATPNSYQGVSTLFRHRRKVKVTKNVRADRLRIVSPMYKIHSVSHKTIKKGTILTVGAPTNHWNHEIWGKGVNPTHKYVWVINRLSGWYELID